MHFLGSSAPPSAFPSRKIVYHFSFLANLTGIGSEKYFFIYKQLKKLLETICHGRLVTP